MNKVTYERTGACGLLTLPAPGAETRKMLCFDTGDMIASPKVVMRKLPNGQFEMCPAPDAIPSSHGIQLFDSAQNMCLRVLDRHAKDDENDVDVSVIGSITTVVVQFAGPRPAVERISRMFFYVAMLPQHYEKTLKAAHFSYVSTLTDPTRRPVEISPTPTPYFRTARLYPVERENMAMHFFSQNGLRDDLASQSVNRTMSEGGEPTAPETPAVSDPVPDNAGGTEGALAAIGNLGKTVPDRMSTYSELIDTATTAERERIAASEKLADCERRYADTVRANIELRKLVTRLYLQRIDRDLLNPEAEARLAAIMAALDVDADIDLWRVSDLLTGLNDVALISEAEMRAAIASRSVPMSRYSQHRDPPPLEPPAQNREKRMRWDAGVSITTDA